MTSEIAILNKEAVALAADSAVTIHSQDNKKRIPKIYNTINKLFALSKYHPVGIMVFGNANLLGIPWESIIKVYREDLKDKSFKSLSDYGNDFINFLNSSNLFSKESQESYFKTTIFIYYHSVILEEINKKIRNEIEENKEITEKEIKNVISKIVNSNYNYLVKKKFVKGFSKVFINKFIQYNSEFLNKAILDVFKKLPLTNSIKEKLIQIAGLLFSKEIFPTGASGLVIAGFGKNDIFPTLIEYKIETIINNKLKYKEETKNTISLNQTAIIHPFAQTEMVYTFIEGVDPVYEIVIKSYLEELFNKYPEVIIDTINSLSKKSRNNFLENLKKAGKKLLSEFQKEMDNYKNENHISPILDSVATLPKPELAEMAEALVSLTSFKRRVSQDAETVGGPIDVAIISKGDGFIWIKRKQYFNLDLNYHFIKKLSWSKEGENK
ncbi:MAG: hypothetical protein KAU01_00760 [Candidatus Cloacimonetes bacterium]|nr:hypothetical protein [Candidatus Cloacimonadota bacterium]